MGCEIGFRPWKVLVEIDTRFSFREVRHAGKPQPTAVLGEGSSHNFHGGRQPYSKSVGKVRREWKLLSRLYEHSHS